RSTQLLRYRTSRDVGVRWAYVTAEGDRQGDGQDDFDLLLVRPVRIVDGFAQRARKRIGAGVTAGARAGSDVQRAGASALRGEEVVGLGDDSARLGVVAGDADLERSVERRLVGELLQLVALPLYRACQQDQSCRPE